MALLLFPSGLCCDSSKMRHSAQLFFFGLKTGTLRGRMNSGVTLSTDKNFHRYSSFVRANSRVYTILWSMFISGL
jgi:hypothetical protein